jgi:hypothetical protein
VPTQLAIAVYLNVNGDVCIRQEGQYGADEDVYIVVTRQNLVPLIARLEQIERGDV